MAEVGALQRGARDADVGEVLAWGGGGLWDRWPVADCVAGHANKPHQTTARCLVRLGGLTRQSTPLDGCLGRKGQSPPCLAPDRQVFPEQPKAARFSTVMTDLPAHSTHGSGCVWPWGVWEWSDRVSGGGGTPWKDTRAALSRLMLFAARRFAAASPRCPLEAVTRPGCWGTAKHGTLL